MNFVNKRRLFMGFALLILFILYLLKNYSMFLRVAGFLSGLIIFFFMDYLFKLDFKKRHYSYVIIILFFGILLSPMYFLSENYDKILHFISPIFGSVLVFYIVREKNISFQWKLLITFMFIISFLAIHEMGEYILDYLWDLKLQGVYIRDTSGIEKLKLVMAKNDDTMIDMMLGTLGGFVFVVGKTISHFIEKKKLK
jgi:hypothetical protein